MKALRTIRVRFIGWYLLVLAALLVCLAIALHTLVGFSLQRSQDDALRRRATALAGTNETRVALDTGQVALEPLGELVAYFQESGDGYRVISARPVEQQVDLAWIDAALAGEPGFYTSRSDDGTRLRFYISLLLPPPVRLVQQDTPPPAPLETDTDATQGANSPIPTVVVVGQPMDRAAAALAALRTTLWIAIPLTLLISSIGGLFLVRRALRPIDRMIETTRGIEERALGERIEVASDDELGRLARTLNAMLGRLERAFRRQQEFTDDASHELRSPLSVIEAEATLALRKARSAQEYRETIAVIAEEAARMSHLTDQLLALARGDAGEAARQVQPLDPFLLVDDVVSTLTVAAEDKDIRLVTDAAQSRSRHARILGDETQMKRVLINLIENAIRHCEEGDTVAASTSLDDRHLVWTIRDTGSGIAEEDLPHIFERFYRADKARGRAAGGSGLGLAICRQIVERHGGTIDVESELGAGTVFRVQLPIDESKVGS